MSPTAKALLALLAVYAMKNLRRADAPPTFDLISMLAHSEATRNMERREFIGNIALLGAQVWGWFEDGHLVSACWAGARSSTSARPCAGTRRPGPGNPTPRR